MNCNLTTIITCASKNLVLERWKQGRRRKKVVVDAEMLTGSMHLTQSMGHPVNLNHPARGLAILADIEYVASARTGNHYTVDI